MWLNHTLEWTGILKHFAGTFLLPLQWLNRSLIKLIKTMPKRKMISMHPPTTPVSNVCRPHPVWGPQLYMWGLHICRVWLVGVYVSFAAPEIMSITFMLQKSEKNKIWNTESESAFRIIKLLSKAYQSTSDKSMTIPFSRGWQTQEVLKSERHTS